MKPNKTLTIKAKSINVQRNLVSSMNSFMKLVIDFSELPAHFFVT